MNTKGTAFCSESKKKAIAFVRIINTVVCLMHSIIVLYSGQKCVLNILKTVDA